MGQRRLYPFSGKYKWHNYHRNSAWYNKLQVELKENQVDNVFLAKRILIYQVLKISSILIISIRWIRSMI